MSWRILQILLWLQRKLHIIWSIALIDVNQWLICIVGNSGAAGLVLHLPFFIPQLPFHPTSVILMLLHADSFKRGAVVWGKVGADVTFNHVTKQNSGALPGSIRARPFALLQSCHSQLTANLTPLWQPAQTAPCTQSPSCPASLTSTPPFSDSMSF